MLQKQTVLEVKSLYFVEWEENDFRKPLDVLIVLPIHRSHTYSRNVDDARRLMKRTQRKRLSLPN